MKNTYSAARQSDRDFGDDEMSRADAGACWRFLAPSVSDYSHAAAITPPVPAEGQARSEPGVDIGRASLIISFCQQSVNYRAWLTDLWNTHPSCACPHSYGMPMSTLPTPICDLDFTFSFHR